MPPPAPPKAALPETVLLFSVNVPAIGDATAPGVAEIVRDGAVGQGRRAMIIVDAAPAAESLLLASGRGGAMTHIFFCLLRPLVLTMLTLSMLPGQNAGIRHSAPNDIVKVTIQVTPGSDATKWTVNFTAENDGPAAVYVMSDPVRSNGNKGFYYQQSQTDRSLLEITSQLYHLPR